MIWECAILLIADAVDVQGCLRCEPVMTLQTSLKRGCVLRKTIASYGVLLIEKEDIQKNVFDEKNISEIFCSETGTRYVLWKNDEAMRKGD